MSNRVLRFINNTSHKEPLDTNQKGDILRTGEDEYSIRIDKEYHVLTDNVKTIETDEYLKAEKTDNNVDLSIDEQQFIELIKTNSAVTSVNGETGDVVIDIPEFEKLTESEVKTMIDGDMWLYDKVLEYTTQNIVTSVNGETGDIVIDIPEDEERIYVDNSEIVLPDWLDLVSNNTFYDSKGMYININVSVNDTFSTSNKGVFSIIFPINIGNASILNRKEIYKVSEMNNDLALVYSNVFLVQTIQSGSKCSLHFEKNDSFNENVSTSNIIHFSCYVAID